jgi:hypothetical protein
LNQTRACTCPDSSTSYQTCVDGLSFSECQCAVAPNPDLVAGSGGAVVPTGGTGGTVVPPPPGTGGVAGGVAGSPPVAGIGPAGTGGAEPPPPPPPPPPEPQCPNAVADFSLMDINPASATYNQMRSLHENCGKVLMIYYTSWG